MTTTPFVTHTGFSLTAHRASSTAAEAPANAFESLLDSVSAAAPKHDGRAVRNILESFLGNGDAQESGGYPFSAAFETTFGLSGPLPAFLRRITSALGLSAEQNAALQDISVRNKDITGTSADVARIRAQLQAAGIG